MPMTFFQALICSESQMPGACGHSVLDVKILIGGYYRTPDLNIPLTRDEDTFGHDQTCSSECSLNVVLGHEASRYGVWRMAPGERGHANSVLNDDVAELKRLEKRNVRHWDC